MKSIIITILLLTPIIGQSATVHKCKDENGKTVFSQRPCGDSSEEVTFKPAPLVGSGKNAKSTDYKQANQEMDRLIDLRRMKRRLRTLKRDLRNTIKERDSRISYLQGKIATAQYANHQIVYPNEIADARSAYGERIRAIRSTIQEQQRFIDQQ